MLLCMVPLSTCLDHSEKTETGIPTDYPVEPQTKVLLKALARQLPRTVQEATYPNTCNATRLDPLLDHYSHTTKDS